MGPHPGRRPILTLKGVAKPMPMPTSIAPPPPLAPAVSKPAHRPPYQRSLGENNARSRASQDRSGQTVAPPVVAASSASAGADAQGSAIVSASGPSWRNARDRAEDVARALNGRRCGSGWICKCPAHSDAAPSLSIADGRHGRPVFFCHAGCDWRDVADALAAKGLAPRFDPKWKARRCR